MEYPVSPTVWVMPTALLSVYDKAGIVEFAAGIHQLGWRLVSSGGTAKAIAAAGTPVTDLAELTGVPAILDHRVVTLHPKIHGGLLADPTKESHRADMAEYGIEAIDLVVCNLYPFASNPSIELIDIGGPAMVRGGEEPRVRRRGRQPGGLQRGARRTPRRWCNQRRHQTSSGGRRVARIAAYDAQIATWFDDAALPDRMHLSLTKAQSLRYGENPHQSGARYRVEGRRSWWDDAVQHGGKEMSYLNLFDTEAAWRLVQRFDAPACVVVKHANPCGVAVSDDITDAYIKANACDPVSAFGGIVALNRAVPVALADALAAVFTEVIVAPAFDEDALAVLSEKKNLRVLSGPEPYGTTLDIRSIDGGLLVQEVDTVNLDRSTWRVVTAAQPTESQWADLQFAWQVCAAVSSNAIVYAKDGQAFGIGAGQQNRLDSARIAAERSAGRADGGVCASDAFFPFRDGLEAAAAAGIRAVIQPGGSVRDDEVIAAADEHGIAMVFTSERHFRH